MALVFKDRVKVAATTTGTGTFTLGAAVTGYQSFSVIGNGNTTQYTIVDDLGNWEVGTGTYTSSGSTLSRDTVLESSNSNNLVDFPAGNKSVFVTYAADKSVTIDNTATLTNKTMSGSSNTFSNIPNSALVTTPVTSVAGTAPIASSGGTTPTISITQASTSTNGYLSSTDWNTFNNKTSNTGTVTSVSGTGTASGLSLSGTVTTSGSLTLSGTVNSLASGTYAIDISGSSATATTATYVNNGTQASSGAVYENAKTISSNYTMTSGYNGMSAGPITISTGVTVTIPTGSNWSIV